MSNIELKLTVGTKQIKGENKKMVKLSHIREIITDAWNVTINHSKEELYVEFVIQFRRVCVKYLYFLKYVEIAILYQMNENIVCAWIDQDKHFENTTTNKVECAYATLKNWMRNSKWVLCKDWELVNQIIQNHHSEIQISFDCNITILEQKFKSNNLYS